MRRWWRRWWSGDDGEVWGLVLEPSMFRRDESRLDGPFTVRAAHREARRFVRRNPYGEVTVFQLKHGIAWPPTLTYAATLDGDIGEGETVRK